MDRIINVKVDGNHISKDNKTAGVRGEANVTKLRLTFDEGWDGFTKKVTFWNARGLNPVVVDLFPHLAESERVYLVPIPAEPMEEAGMFTFVIEGAVDDKVQRSVKDELEVKDAPIEKNAGQPVPPTKNELTQLAEEIEKINSDILEVRNAKEDTQKSAQSADEDAEAANIAMNNAKKYAKEAQEYSEKAQNTVGKTSYIGENGNWYAWDEEKSDFYDTGIRAQSGSVVYCGDNPPDEADVWINPDDNDTLISIDTEMSDTSENPVQNKVVKGYVDNIVKDIKAKVYTVYGVSIDLLNSNPETAVTYTDDAVGMRAGSSNWYKMSIFKDIKPCLFKDGAVVDYLNPDNFAQFEDGTAADITSGNGGDVMIEIPKTGYKITKSGNTLTVQITDDPNKDDFCYKAHTRTNEGDREKLYIGAFLGSNKGDKLRSISGVSPLANTKLSDFRNYAKANGVGYDLFAFYPLTLLQCLYLIMYKNLDSQASIGKGYIGGYTDTHSTKNTGATFDKGMSYGTSDRMEQMKFLGIEDFWGNLHQWIDGLVSDKNGNALVATDNFNDTGDGYTNAGMVSTSIGGYMKAPQGTNDLGFIIGTVGGSTSTYFSDGASFGGGYVPIFGGCFSDNDDAGIFRLRVFADSTYGYRLVGGRLMFL